MSADRTIYKFGNFELNPSESSLSESGTAVQITPKAFRLLCVLTENPGRVLDKSYLLDQVWQNDHVEEGNLTFNIRQLRKILGDEVKNPKFIETVPKRGYRFIGDVETTIRTNGKVTVPLAPVLETVPERRQENHRPLWRSLVFAIPLILAAGGVVTVESWFGIFGGGRATPKLLTNEFSSERLSTDGNVRHVTISKSGDFIVYAADDQNDKQSLRIRDLSTGHSRELIGISGDRFFGLDISNDDSIVYFVRGAVNDPANACLFKIKMAGSIAESLVCGVQGWFDLSDDGETVSYVRCNYAPNDNCSLYISDETFKNERLLVTRAKPDRITDNAISPDGRSVVFAAGQTSDGSADFGIYRFDLETNVETPVVDDKFLNVLGIDWMPDGNSLLATCLLSNDANISFWNVELDARTATPLRHGHDSFKAISMDREGSKLVSTIRSADFRVFVHSMDKEASPVGLGNGWTARFSADGRILFASERSNKFAIWSADPDGTDVKQLSSGSDEFPIASADGSAIFFTSRRSGRIEVWKMQPDGSGASQLSQKEGGFPIGVSSDGYWVYYLSSMNRSLHRVSSDGAIEEQVTQIRMDGAAISPDTRFAAFFDRNSKTPAVSMYSLVSNERPASIPFPGTAMEGKHLAWSGNGNYIYAVLFDATAKTNAVWRLSIDGSPAVKIRDLNVQELGERSSFTVSPDDRYFAVSIGHWKHDAVLVHGLK